MNKPIKKIKLGAKNLMLAAVATIALSTASCSKEEEGEEIIQYNDKVIVSINNSPYQFVGGPGETFETVENRNETAAIQFSSKDPEIASIDETGKITMQKPGQTEVYGLMNNDTILRKSITIYPKATVKIGDKEFQQACYCGTYHFTEDSKTGNYWSFLLVNLYENNKGQANLGCMILSTDGTIKGSSIYPGEPFSYSDAINTTVNPTDDFVYSITDNGDDTFHLTIEGTLESKESFKFEYNGPIPEPNF